MSSLQKLIVHVGPPKTGSSALQAYFAANRPVFLKNNIGYHHSPQFTRPDLITSGNGLKLYQALNGDCSREELENTIRSYCQNHTLSICSSEYLAAVKVEQWELFRKACESMSIEPTMVVFVRDVEPFFRSAYNQGVKRHGRYQDYAEFAMNSPRAYHHVIHLRTILEAFEIKAVRVIYYEEARDALDLAFWKSLALPYEQFDRAAIQKKVNRSLISCEIDILRNLNKATGLKYTVQLSDYLIYARPDLVEEGVSAPEIVSLLKENYQDDIDWVNALFFNGRKALKVVSDEVQNFTPISEALVRDIQRDVAGWLMLRLAGNDNRPELISEDLARYLHRVRQEDPGLVAKFFDASYYLRTYPDIAAARLDPLMHYFKFGLLERRRPVSDMSGFLEALLLAQEIEHNP
jgi:hypothetical protein